MPAVTNQNTQWLVTTFDFERNEFMIGFYNVEQAQQYQSANREARILENDSRRDVWIPKPKGMTSISVSGGSLALNFSREVDAERWCEKIVIGRRSNKDRKVVYLRREWKEDELRTTMYKKTEGLIERANGARTAKNDWPKDYRPAQHRKGD